LLSVGLINDAKQSDSYPESFSRIQHLAVIKALLIQKFCDSELISLTIPLSFRVQLEFTTTLFTAGLNHLFYSVPAAVVDCAAVDCPYLRKFAIRSHRCTLNTGWSLA
jgi:hypothetical protein